MLKYRILTALVLIPLVIAGVFLLPMQYFVSVCGGLLMWAAWEWTYLMGLKNFYKRAFFILFVLAVFYIILLFPIKIILWFAFAWWLIALYWVVIYPEEVKLWKQKWLQGFFGLHVLIPCWLSLISLRSYHQGPELVMFLLLLIWGADIAAYFVGRVLGKRKLAPAVSPGKTWEGFAGAMIVTLLLGIAGGFYFQMQEWSWLIWIAVCLLTSAASVLGDLLESMMKRARNIKDSGSLLPGHGGLLDRIDSLTAAAPIFTLGILTFGLLHL